MSANTSSPLFIGIDVGTSGIRAIAMDAHYQVCAEATTTLPTPIQNNSVIEQDPELWWSALTTVLESLTTKVDPQHIKALSLDGTSGTVLLCDAKGEPLSPGLMYNDARAIEYLDNIEQHAPVDSAVHSATSGLAKLLWLKNQSYAEHCDYFCHQADWLVGKLTGHYGHSDINNSLKSGYDAINKLWPQWLDDLNIDRDWLPQVHTPGNLVGVIDMDIAKQLGLPATLKIYSGTTDSTAAIIATGACEPGEAITSLGSTLVLKIITEQPVFNRDYGIYSQPFGDFWLAGGSSNSGGAVLRHYFTDAQMQAMEAELNYQQSTELNYYPLLQDGERFPHNDPSWPARLEPRPENNALFFQGILEGLTNIEHDGYRLLEVLGAPYPERVYTVGGGSVNITWMHMRQQYLGASIVIPEHTEAAYGMALLAKQGFEVT